MAARAFRLLRVKPLHHGGSSVLLGSSSHASAQDLREEILQIIAELGITGTIAKVQRLSVSWDRRTWTAAQIDMPTATRRDVGRLLAELGAA